MTPEATLLMDEALKTVKLDGTFKPTELGARIGLKKAAAETAARALSDAGVIVIGFDSAAEFSSEFRKMHAPPKVSASAKRKTTPRRKKTQVA